MSHSESERRDEIAARLRIAIVRMSRRLRQEGGSGLSPSLASALVTVRRDGPLTPSELADRERLARSVVSRIVAQLERQELVRRVPDAVDGRSYRIEITSRGVERIAAARKRSRAYLSRALRDLDDEELAALERAAHLFDRLFREEP